MNSFILYKYDWPTKEIDLENEDDWTAHLDKSLGTPSLIKIANDSATQLKWRDDMQFSSDNCILDLMKLIPSGNS